MDNTDTLKEIAERLTNQLHSNVDQGCASWNELLAVVLPALSEAYNLGLSVSVKEYAVEVLEGLKKEVEAEIAVNWNNRSCATTDEIQERYSVKISAYKTTISLIESTITQIKSNPSGNIGIPSKEDYKKVATSFFYWWWNQGGTNTEQGFDKWWELREKALPPSPDSK